MLIKLFSFDLETRTGNSKVNQVSGVLIKVLWEKKIKLSGIFLLNSAAKSRNSAAKN